MYVIMMKESKRALEKKVTGWLDDNKNMSKERTERDQTARNMCVSQSHEVVASTPSSYKLHPRPTTNSEWRSWICLSIPPPGPDGPHFIVLLLLAFGSLES
jgi:hypothetical protein